MKREDSHLSDEQLLLDLDRELSPREEKLVESHLGACRKCQERRHELEYAIGSFVRFQREAWNAELPPAHSPRASLNAQLRQISQGKALRRPNSGSRFAWPAFAASLLVFGLVIWLFVIPRGKLRSLSSGEVFSLPISSLTPGATVLLDRQTVCAQDGSNNKAVPLALQRKVFEEYRIGNADPQAYEVDYLVTPALGGADDIRNLWPHSYSSTMWNARIKDALESRLRDLVCAGDVDLRDAQREIATNWIAAYKKYFHTQAPLSEHHREH